MEPVLTYDLDVFIFLPQKKSKVITLAPIYEYLQKKGYKTHHEHIIIEGVPVQFIPAYDELVEEAVTEAMEIKYKGTKTRVLRVEHLLAIMLRTDRPKDRARLTQIVEQGDIINMDYLTVILQRHGLQKKWQEFQMRFYGK